MAFDCQYKLTLVGEIAVTDAPVRAVVIGAGVGGLSAALRLAHAGLAVTIIDMGDGPGGKMRTRGSAAGPIDIGPTVMTLKRVFETLFADVGARLSDFVTLIPDEVLARHHWPDGSSLDLFHDAEQSADAVRAFAGPEGERQFRRFSDRAKRLYDAFEGPVMQAARPSLPALTAHVLKNPGLIPAMAPGRTLAATLAAQFSDPRLRQLFGRYATYVGGSPYSSPAVLSLIWQSGGGRRLARRRRHEPAGAGDVSTGSGQGRAGPVPGQSRPDRTTGRPGDRRASGGWQPPARRSDRVQRRPQGAGRRASGPQPCRGRAAQGCAPTAACRPLSGVLPPNPPASIWRITTSFLR